MWQHAPTQSDTIVAQASAPGEAAIAVVRLSGRDATKVAASLIAGRLPQAPRHLTRVRLRQDGDEMLDDAVMAVMPGPASYTGEDVVEFYLHGARIVVDMVLERAINAGARQALAGEFTLRAFVNGKMDLSQAEAVADLVASCTQSQLSVAHRQLSGALGSQLGPWLEVLEKQLATLRAVLDFPEDDSGASVSDGMQSAVKEVLRGIDALVHNARLELRAGRRVVLCGPPNAGKSTLLNTLAGEERVLVDEAPGTTRDPIEHELVIEGRRILLCDTAGLRPQADGLEARGAAMARDRVQNAEQAFWLLDPTEPVWPPGELDVAIVGSKADLCSGPERKRLHDAAIEAGRVLLGWVSPLHGEGVDDFKRWMLGESVPTHTSADVVVVRRRHLDELKKAQHCLSRFVDGSGLTLDVMAMELEEATYALGRVLGREVDAEVLEQIFSEFCIGK